MAEVRIDIIEDYKDTGAYKKMEASASSAMSKLKTAGDTIKAAWLEITLVVTAVTAAYKMLDAGVSTAQNLASETRKLMMTTGMMAEEASTLIAVADQVGISYDTIQNAVTAVARKMGGLKDIESEVTDETGKTVDVFDKFGVTVKNADGSVKSFSDVFGQIREKIQSTSNETERLAIATQFFRGGAVQLMPLLTMTSAQFKELADDAKKFGLVLTQDNIVAAKAYTMAQRDLDDALTGLKLVVGQALIPVLTVLAKWVAEKGSEFIAFAEGIRSLVVPVFQFLGITVDKSNASLDKQAEAHKTAAAAAQDNAQKMAATAKVLESYAAAVEKIGEAQLKIAGEDFSSKLKEDSDSVGKMKAALTGYLESLSQVYSARIVGERQIATLMAQTNDPAKIAAQQARILQIEQQGAQQRLAAWQQYYTALEQGYAKTVNEINALSIKIDAGQQRMIDNEWNYYDIVNRLRQTDMTEEQKYYDNLRILDEKYNAAMQLDGEARIQMLKSIQASEASLVGTIKDGDLVKVTSAQTVATAYERITQAQNAIRETEANMLEADRATRDEKIASIQELAVEMTAAQQTVESLKNRVIELDNALAQQKILAIDTAGAVAGINELRMRLDAIPAITYKQVVMQFKTEASPQMPFTEGMAHIQSMLNSLPTGSEYTMKFTNLAADWQRQTALAERVTGYERAGMNVSYDALKQRDEAERKSNDLWAELANMVKSVRGSGGGGPMIGTYAPNITVGAGAGQSGKALAQEIDAALADDVKYDRSKTFIEIKKKIG